MLNELYDPLIELNKSDLLPIILHEMRAPLSNINASIEMLLHSAVDERTHREILEIMGTQSARLTRLVEEFFDVVVLENNGIRLDLQPLALGPLVREVVKSFCYPVSTHRFDVQLPPGLPLVLGDRNKVETILRNLIGNAMNYSPEGTLITIGGEDRAEGVVVSISDQGTGIPSDALTRIFDRFYRVEDSSVPRVRGMGLGLHIAKLLVEAHNGEIWVESKVGEGSTFSFLLPKLNLEDAP
ncbi:MAG: hypothetical protein H5T62_07685 [Anaerolineae bacterium]|nr:hypothetical protein [Anaerolineae bacterium]